LRVGERYESAIIREADEKLGEGQPTNGRHCVQEKCCRFAGQRFRGYTVGMKTAVSVPDDIFEGAERLAVRTKRSRSRIFSDALREYLARHSPEEVTEAVNKACAEIDEVKDQFVASATRRILERSQW
jgi:predicted transcriptional regulator